MQVRSQIIKSIKDLPINEKLLIVEAILQSIRNNDAGLEPKDTKPEILELAGSITESEAYEWQNAINEGRQIDVNEW